LKYIPIASAAFLTLSRASAGHIRGYTDVAFFFTGDATIAADFVATRILATSADVFHAGVSLNAAGVTGSAVYSITAGATNTTYAAGAAGIKAATTSTALTAPTGASGATSFAATIGRGIDIG
jgi:hypothetical protein